MKTRFVLTSLAMAAGVALAQEAGFKSLFNGRDLTGWQGNSELWSVQDGAITGVTKAEPKLTHNTFLVWTNGAVDDFELRLSYRIVNGNSGIQYRSKVLREGKFGPIVGGYQADFEAGKTYSGILYEEQGRGILAQRGQKTVIRADGTKHKVDVAGSVGDTKEIQAKIKPEEWNEYVVIAKGNHLQHFINGVPTVDVTDEHEAKAAKSGVLALQIHVGPPMTVQFKNIRIKALSKQSAGGNLIQQMAGTWAAVEATLNGEEVGRERLDTALLTIKGSSFSSRFGERRIEGKISIDESKKPATLDIVRTRSSGEKQTIPAICEIKDDTLRICYGIGDSGLRPVEFKSEVDSGTALVAYKRE